MIDGGEDRGHGSPGTFLSSGNTYEWFNAQTVSSVDTSGPGWHVWGSEVESDLGL
jgi:hypothetical protein